MAGITLVITLAKAPKFIVVLCKSNPLPFLCEFYLWEKQWMLPWDNSEEIGAEWLHLLCVCTLDDVPPAHPTALSPTKCRSRRIYGVVKRGVNWTPAGQLLEVLCITWCVEYILIRRTLEMGIPSFLHSRLQCNIDSRYILSIGFGT